MSINISITENTELKPKIVVFGVGGAGGNAINNMVKANLEGVDFWVANTDAQALNHSLVPNARRIQLGASSTRGLGAGSHPDVGGKAAEESMAELQEILESANMCFITAGMGGGTGTGAAPVIARLAREMGILTVGVVTKPFHFEGARRMRVAEVGLMEMQKHVDTLIVIPNQNLFRIANEKTTFAQAFGMADEVLHSGVRSITDLITLPGIVNLDFADIRTIMFQSGKAMMGTGEAEGEKRSIKAAENAISNPLLDISSMKGAKGVLINISGGMDMTLYELDEAANRIKEEVDPEANIIVGSAFNDSLDGKIRVSVVATGIEHEVRSEFANSHMVIDPKEATLKAQQKVRETAAVMFSSEHAAAQNDSDSTVAEQCSPIGAEEDFESSVQFPTFRQERGLFDDEEVSRDENDKLELEVSNDDIERSEHSNRREIEDKKTDIFDIPAFLRRKIGKK